MMDLEFTKTAIEDYDDCIQYVANKFSEKRALKFVLEMKHNLELICKNPKAFPKSDYKDIRYVVVMKPITIFYTIVNENKVQIISIWNNRKEKNYSKIKR